MGELERTDAAPERRDGLAHAYPHLAEMTAWEEVSTVQAFMLAIAPGLAHEKDAAAKTLKLAITLTGELAKFRREALKTVTPPQADPESYPKAGGSAAGL